MILLYEAVYGFRYIVARPSLLGLQTIAFISNIFGGIFFALMAPMILARTSNNELILGSVQSVAASGVIVGALVLTAWGGFKRRVHGILLGYVVAGLFGCVVMGLRFGLPVWLAGAFVATFVIPMVMGSTQAIWQSKVAPDVQGRVFASRRLIAWSSQPITPIVAGLLADRWLEPAMQATGGIAQFWSPLVGTGPGAGMAILMIVCGLATATVGIVAYFVRVVRDAELLLPDHGGALGSNSSS